ncbi:transglycosylase SLT domain-containing protein [Buchnera aphidicola]|uniref:transglycosylase SLT domain-containing protein n=1 Tax=Buchnera aphidicola TaxID=9 RepID=UPI003BEEC8D8
MILSILIFIFIFLTGFNGVFYEHHLDKTHHILNKKTLYNSCKPWDNLIKVFSDKYNIDKTLVKSIIYVESTGNTYAKSKSNAIGLMQIKPFSAGLEVYRFLHKKGHPSIKQLYNPKINISIGTAYISLLQKKMLYGIQNKDILRYSTILSYVNGNKALLNIFSLNKKKAISIINNMTKKEFCIYIKKNIHQNKLYII